MHTGCVLFSEFTASASVCYRKQHPPTHTHTPDNPLTSVWILTGFLKRDWRMSTGKVSVEYGPCARHGNYFTYSSLKLWISYMVVFPFNRQEDQGSVKLSYLVDSISRTVIPSLCRLLLASLFYQSFSYGALSYNLTYNLR